MLEREIVDRLNSMCIESLSPELMEKWESVKDSLNVNRKFLNGTADEDLHASVSVPAENHKGKRLNVGSMIEVLSNYPKDTPIGLLDTSTDDYSYGNYGILDQNIHVDDYVLHEGGEVQGKMVFICFQNSLNENPI